MYLSRLILNPLSRRVQRELAEPYQMHKTLMRCFPDDLDREADRVLFRVDADPRSGALTVLIQSTLEPGWDWLADNGARGYLLAEHLLPLGIDKNPDTKSFDVQLAPGQVLAFRLRANPTVKRRFPNGDHKRVGLYREEEQRTWLDRKAAAGGFRILSVSIRDDPDVGGPIHRGDESHKLKLLAVRFDGVLQVTDPEHFQETLRQGIGSGKGLGFGLLSLARA
jgi:CRISPR system Cascade subunit CasE